MRTSRLALFCLSLSLGCAGASPEQRPAAAQPAPGDDAGAPEPETGEPEPGAESAAASHAQREHCPDSRDASPPSWALRTTAPIPSATNLTGMWIPIAGYDLPPPNPPARGPVERTELCAEGIRAMAIEQTGSRIRAAWAIRERAQGALFVDWRHDYEVETGSFRSGAIELAGYFITERGKRESTKINRECRPVAYSLTYDAGSGHLVGTRDGKPIRLAPLVIKPLAGGCGKPPA